MIDFGLNEFRERLEQFRSDFDAAFASSAERTPEHRLDLLCLRVCGARFAVDSKHVTGVHPTRGLTRVPSPVRSFRGVSQLRGRPLAVFDLAELCGCEDDARPRRYLFVLSGMPPIGLAFTNVERLVRVPIESLSTRADVENLASRAWLDDGIEVPLLEASILRERIAHASASGGRRK